MRGPVFIIGGSRTGSEMLKTALSASPDLDFVDELFLLCPAWLHKDLETNIAEHVGSLQAPGALDRLLELLFSGVPYGWVWSVAEQKFDRQRLRERLSGTELSMRSILDALMRVHAEKNGKQGTGGKFPTHYSETHRLLEWFPDCRLVHTTRDPRAVYASQANKYVRPQDPALSRAWMKARQFAHINIQVTWTARLHRQLRGLPNYTLVRYEDVVREPEMELKRLCGFLGVDFLPGMLSPKQYGSSFSEIGRSKGIAASSLEAWRSRISPLTAAFLRFAHPIAWRRFGYGA